VKRPNGCSVVIKKPGTKDVFVIKKDVYSFREPCNIHDSCYYAIGSNAKNCNHLFLSKMNEACESSGSDDTRALCYDRARVFYDAVEVAAPMAHTHAQYLEKKYLERVENYLKKH
jgi:hypothetical protein